MYSPCQISNDDNSSYNYPYPYKSDDMTAIDYNVLTRYNTTK